MAKRYSYKTDKHGGVGCVYDAKASKQSPVAFTDEVRRPGFARHIARVLNLNEAVWSRVEATRRKDVGYKGQIFDPRMPHGVTQMSLAFVRQNLEVIAPVSMIQFRRMEEEGARTYIYGRYGCLVTDGFEVGYGGEGPRGLQDILHEVGFCWDPRRDIVDVGRFIEWTKSSCHRGTIEELSGVICKECGAEIRFGFGKEVEDRMRRLGVCVSCEFWLGWVERRDDSRVARVNHVHYFVEDEFDTCGVRGFDGRRFVIEWNDGRRATTTNLWCQGDIPEYFWDRLPDNAKFVK